MLIPLAISFILPFVYGKSKREEAEENFVTRTKFPGRFVWFSIISLIFFVLLFVVAIIYLSITENDLPYYAWLIVIVCFMAFILLSLLCVLISLGTYEVIYSDGILIKRLFKKKVFVSYSEMKAYRYSLGQFTVYGKDHNILFGVYENRVGMQALINQLDVKGVYSE